MYTIRKPWHGSALYQLFRRMRDAHRRAAELRSLDRGVLQELGISRNQAAFLADHEPRKHGAP